MANAFIDPAGAPARLTGILPAVVAPANPSKKAWGFVIFFAFPAAGRCGRKLGRLPAAGSRTGAGWNPPNDQKTMYFARVYL